MAPSERSDGQRNTAVRIDLLGQYEGGTSLRSRPAHEVERRLKLRHRGRPGDGMLSQPKRADHPRIARDALAIARRGLIRIVFVPRQSAGLGLHPEHIETGGLARYEND